MSYNPRDTLSIFLSHPLVDWYQYAHGYRVATFMLADRVLDECAKDKTYSLNFTLYPVLFLYRQYVELQLKFLIRYSQLLVDNLENEKELINGINSLRGSHNIDSLFLLLLKILKANRFTSLTSDNPIVKELKAARKAINTVFAMDPLSTAFRYPEDKNRAPSIDGVVAWDVGYLMGLMERYADLFDRVSENIRVALGKKNEADFPSK